MFGQFTKLITLMISFLIIKGKNTYLTIKDLQGTAPAPLPVQSKSKLRETGVKNTSVFVIA